MKLRVIAALLLLTMLLGLTACGSRRDSVPESEKEELLAILDDLSRNFHPGTAGSSLQSVRLAADLVAWAATTDMDKKEAASIVMNWLKEQSPEIRASVQEKLTSIGESYSRIIKDGAADLLESAGVKEDMSNLGTRLKELVEAVLESGGLD